LSSVMTRIATRWMAQSSILEQEGAPRSVPGRRSLGILPVHRDQARDPHVRHLDHIRVLFMRPDAATLISPGRTLVSGSKEKDLGIVREPL
jgi:hypothetical protein